MGAPARPFASKLVSGHTSDKDAREFATKSPPLRAFISKRATPAEAELLGRIIEDNPHLRAADSAMLARWAPSALEFQAGCDHWSYSKRRAFMSLTSSLSLSHSGFIKLHKTEAIAAANDPNSTKVRANLAPPVSAVNLTSRAIGVLTDRELSDLLYFSDDPMSHDDLKRCLAESHKRARRLR